MSTYIRYINTSMLNIRSPMNIILRFRFFRTNPHICRKTSSTMPLMLTWLIALKFHSSFFILELPFDSTSFAVVHFFYEAIYHMHKQIQCRCGYNHDKYNFPSIHCFCILSLCHSMAKKMPKSLRRGYWLVGHCVIGVDG